MKQKAPKCYDSCSTDKFVELQIPPDTGNGSWNAGIPLARLFWHLPSAPLMALIQALLLERRVVMVAQERDTLSAGLHAAAALLYPFRWQHIYLPYLPHSLKVRPHVVFCSYPAIKGHCTLEKSEGGRSPLREYRP